MDVAETQEENVKMEAAPTLQAETGGEEGGGLVEPASSQPVQGSGSQDVALALVLCQKCSVPLTA